MSLAAISDDTTSAARCSTWSRTSVRTRYGRRFEALDLVKGKEFDVEIMAGGRIARIVPDPITWSVDRFGTTKTSNVAFFLDAEGELRVGTVLPQTVVQRRDE